MRVKRLHDISAHQTMIHARVLVLLELGKFVLSYIQLEPIDTRDKTK
jgi:hypothetical protein